MIRLFAIGFFSLLVVAFAVANLHIVVLNTVFGEGVRASLAFLLFGAFAAGYLVATLRRLGEAIDGKQRRGWPRRWGRRSVELPALPSIPSPTEGGSPGLLPPR